MRKLEHGPDYRISDIMIEVQKAKDFPLQVKIGRGTVTLQDEHEASLFSLGICVTIEAKMEENEWELGEDEDEKSS